MKSKYFKQYTLNDDGKKNVGVLAGLSEKSLEILYEWFSGLKSYPWIDVPNLKLLSEKTGESAEIVRKAINAIDILAKRMGELGDTPEDLLSDIMALKILAQPSPQLVQFLKKMSSISKSYYIMYRTNFVSRSGIPNLQSTTMSVAVKPIFDKDFTYNVDDITQYAPSLINCSAVAHVSLDRDDNETTFAFQLTKEDLDRFITDLLVLQKQLILAEETLKISTGR